MVSKQQLRADTEDLVAKFFAQGGEVKKIDTSERGVAYGTARDWKRRAQGLKVATPDEVAAERERRMLVAVGNKDARLCLALAQGQHDKAIRFDIENGRLGPNGEIK